MSGEVKGQLKAEHVVSNLNDFLGKIRSSLDRISKYESEAAYWNGLILQNREKLKSHVKDLMEQQDVNVRFSEFKSVHEMAMKHLRDEEKELAQREKLLEVERTELAAEREKLSDNGQAAAEKRRKQLRKAQKETEKLRGRITTLEEELDSKEGLETQKERLMVAIEVIGDIGNGETKICDDEVKTLQDQLLLKESELQSKILLTQSLADKEWNDNAEVWASRKELIDYFNEDPTFSRPVGVKSIGKLDSNLFRTAAKRKYPGEESDAKADEICSLYHDLIKDGNWYPFKLLVGKDGLVQKAIIDEDDERLIKLKTELGSKVYSSFVATVVEMNECNPSGLYVYPELWNFKEKRKATLKEGVSLLLKQLNQRKVMRME